MGLFSKKPPKPKPTAHVMPEGGLTTAAFNCPSMVLETRLTRKKNLTGLEYAMLKIPTLIYEEKGTPMPGDDLILGDDWVITDDSDSDSDSDSNKPYAIPTGFTPGDKICITKVMLDCAEAAEIAYQASTVAFEEYMDIVEIWFGQELEITAIQEIIKNVYLMRRFMNSKDSMVKFMDVRDIRKVAPSSGLSYMSCSLQNLHVPSSAICENQSTSITMFIGKSMFHPSDDQMKMAMIFHELSHQLFGTIDTNSSGAILMEKAALRRESHMMQFGEAVNLATAWGYFMASFSQSEEDFDNDILS